MYDEVIDLFSDSTESLEISSIGIFNGLSATVEMFNLTAIGSGGSEENCGVWNHYAPSVIMRSVIATASGGIDSQGVRNIHADGAILNDITATASGASTYNYGVYNSN